MNISTAMDYNNVKGAALAAQQQSGNAAVPVEQPVTYRFIDTTHRIARILEDIAIQQTGLLVRLDGSGGNSGFGEAGKDPKSEGALSVLAGQLDVLENMALSVLNNQSRLNKLA